jgi:hypothetical protein
MGPVLPCPPHGPLGAGRHGSRGSRLRRTTERHRPRSDDRAAPVIVDEHHRRAHHHGTPAATATDHVVADEPADNSQSEALTSQYRPADSQ